MNDTPLLTNGQLIAYTVSIVTALGAVVSVLFWQLRAAQDRTFDQYKEATDRERASCQAEKEWLREQLISFRRDFASEAKEDRAVMEKLRETVQAATDPAQRGRR